DQVTTRPRTGRDAPKTANRKAEGPEGEGRELRFPGLRRRLDHDGGLSSAGASWVKHESTRPDARAGPRLARRGQISRSPGSFGAPCTYARFRSPSPADKIGTR